MYQVRVPGTGDRVNSENPQEDELRRTGHVGGRISVRGPESGLNHSVLNPFPSLLTSAGAVDLRGEKKHSILFKN